MREPADIALTSQPPADYVFYPEGHPSAGSVRFLDLAWVVLAVIAIQILITAAVRVARRQAERSS